MSESPRRQAVVVGLFVTFGVAILTGGILTIGNIHNTFSRKIEVKAVFDGVNGLQVGNNIWFSGVKVGTVKRMALEKDSTVAVEMAIDREAAQFIHADALAKVSSDGVIGNKIIVIYEGSLDKPLIEDGGWLAAGDVVSTEAMIEMAQQNNANLLEITTDIKTLTKRIAAGEGSVGKLLADDALYDKVTATVDEMNTAATSAKDVTASLSTFTRKLNAKGSLPNDLVTDKEIYPSIKASAASLQSTSTRASALVDGIATSAADPNTPIGTLLTDEETAKDIKSAISNVDTSSKLLAEDLEAAQHNILLRGYFRKKEKAARKAGTAPGAEASDSQVETPVEPETDEESPK